MATWFVHSLKKWYLYTAHADSRQLLPFGRRFKINVVVFWEADKWSVCRTFWTFIFLDSIENSSTDTIIWDYRREQDEQHSTILITTCQKRIRNVLLVSSVMSVVESIVRSTEAVENDEAYEVTSLIQTRKSTTL